MAYPYVPARDHGGRQDSWDRIVIHGTVSGTYCGGARDIARYFQNPTYVSSAHYVVDPCEVIQSVWDHTIAYHAPPNRGSIGVELCDPVDAPGGRWQDADHQKMLALAAEVTRKRCEQKDVPMIKLGGRELRAGKRGICGHDDVRDAWGQTDHWDPGPDFPWDYFIALVRGEEDDMPSAQEVADALLDTPIKMLDGRMWKVRYVLANIEKDTDLIPKRVLEADMVPKYDVAYSEENMENNPKVTLKYGVAQAVANGAKAENAVGALKERMAAYEEKLDMILQKLEN